MEETLYVTKEWFPGRINVKALFSDDVIPEDTMNLPREMGEDDMLVEWQGWPTVIHLSWGDGLESAAKIKVYVERPFDVQFDDEMMVSDGLGELFRTDLYKNRLGFEYDYELKPSFQHKDEVVLRAGGEELTLKEGDVFERANGDEWEFKEFTENRSLLFTGDMGDNMDSEIRASPSVMCIDYAYQVQGLPEEAQPVE